MQIIQYQQIDTNGWNPCLSVIFNHNKTITITLDSNKMMDWRDWYPLGLCDTANNSARYHNECLFDGGDCNVYCRVSIRLSLLEC